MTPLTLSSPTKASLFPIILWRCLAGSEHGITQPRPHDLRWVVRRAAGPKPSPQQAEYCCHPASRLRSFRSARSSSGSPLLEVDRPRRWRADTAGDDPKRMSGSEPAVVAGWVKRRAAPVNNVQLHSLGAHQPYRDACQTQYDARGGGNHRNHPRGLGLGPKHLDEGIAGRAQWQWTFALPPPLCRRSRRGSVT